MKILKFLLFALLAICFVTQMFPLERIFEFKDFSTVHFGFGSGIEVLLGMAIPPIDISKQTDVGLGKTPYNYDNIFIQSLSSEGEIPFGRAVSYGTTRSQAKLLTGSTAKFMGVSRYSVSSTKVDENKYGDKEPCGIQQTGPITVYVEEAVNAGDRVRIRHTNHATDPTKIAGNFCKNFDAGKTFQFGLYEFQKTTTGPGETIIVLLDNAVTVTNDV